MKFDAYLESLIAKRVSPGFNILVARREQVLYRSSVGRLTYDPHAAALGPDACYDVASLTKPLITALLGVYLMERGMLAARQCVNHFLPDCQHPITVAQLLTHSSGLPAWYPFYLYPHSESHQIAQLSLQFTPGSAVLYSCPGYIILRAIIEKAAGMDALALASEVIFGPLALNHTFLQVPPHVKQQCPPTERGNGFERALCQAEHEQAARDFKWRTEVIQGDAHDANAFYAGGYAGNAGLFSTVADLHRLALELFPQTATILKADSVRLFHANQAPKHARQRSYGFAINHAQPSSAGRVLAQNAIGHTGFTGTSLWLEPDIQGVWLILANRVHPKVKKINFDCIRRGIYRRLYTEVI